MCKDVKGFIDYVCQKREVADPLFRVGIDGGQGFVKVCLNIIDTRSLSDVPCSREKGTFKDSGVKKLFILGIVEDKCEMYENLREILQNLHFKLSKEFCLAGDLKVCNIVAGLQSHSSKYPCTWCYATAPYAKKAKLRTLGQIQDYYESYVNDGRKNAKKYFNCVHEPLINGERSDEMLDLIPPPSLHLMLGVVNTLLDKLHEKWNQAYTWAANQGIVKKNYHGGQMEGNACRKLLKKAHILQTALPRRLAKFAHAMSHFDQVVNACFKSELKSDFLIKIERFRKSYMKLGINVTPKVHAVFEHVGEFCKRRKMGLARYAEQASESVHYDFLHQWKWCKCETSHPNYDQNLCSCVVKYNSKHIF